MTCAQKILMVITPHLNPDNAGEKIRFWVVKLASPNNVFKDKVVTGFSNTEEKAVQLAEVSPFLLAYEIVTEGS